MKKFIFAILLLSHLVCVSAAPIRIVYANLQGRDPALQFSFAVLKLALEKSGTPFELVKSPYPMTDARAVVEIMNKNVDVAWLGNSSQSETDLLPVMIPISRGLLGYRIPLIRADKQNAFALVNDVAGLKNLQAGLGVGWPIAAAWHENDLPISTVGTFESLFKMTQAARVDYVPFGAGNIHNYWSQSVKEHPDLVIENHIVVVYPYYDYFFFVHRANQKLHDLIESGLKKAYADGSYKNLFLNHPEFAGLKDLKLEKRRVILLRNFHITKEEFEVEPKYWINPRSPYAF